ncbi:MAG TPA: FAD-dependent thymidylate synthase [Anaerolineaceae bacterium]|nr:FAD-dependent thymidylate synthase [Anaerolineaceae bacterium]
MPQNRQIYLLDPHDLTPETIAVTFAKTSRSPLSFQQIADELTDEKSAEFHEKWVVGYGHASVAEHAVLHIAVENVSRLAVECLESNRLASYTEKSTRYQKWDENSFYIPTELDNRPELKEKYLKTNINLFQTYLKSLPIVREEIGKRNPKGDDESDAAWERRIRSDYVDICRFLLPASALANVGVTINARALEHAIKKMLSHPLEEVQLMGKEIKQVSQTNVPTLVKYADEVPYWEKVTETFNASAKTLSTQINDSDWCYLIDFDQEVEKRILSSLLYKFSNLSYEEIYQNIQLLDHLKIENLINEITKDIQRFDIPVRELEYATFTFDLLMDQGAYFEIKRHRMMTQTTQNLSTLNGYAVPKIIVDAGFEQDYHQAMQLAHQTYLEISDWNPHVASYVVPNGYNRRLLLKANLRSLDHLLNLRSAPNAHFSVRRIAQRMAEEIIKVNPLLCNLFRYNHNETWQSIQDDYFAEINHKL